MHNEILAEINSITPYDNTEEKHIEDCKSWIRSGAELCRTAKPATPPKHLVSYFAVVDLAKQSILLVDHKKAGLWPPTGGHVEPKEHPRTTVQREAKEELGIEVEFKKIPAPLMLTISETVGNIEKHIDVSLWYVLEGDSNEEYHFDVSEFNTVKWFRFKEVPFERADLNLGRFISKTIITEKTTLITDS